MYQLVNLILYFLLIAAQSDGTEEGLHSRVWQLGLHHRLSGRRKCGKVPRQVRPRGNQSQIALCEINTDITRNCSLKYTTALILDAEQIGHQFKVTRF